MTQKRKLFKFLFIIFIIFMSGCTVLEDIAPTYTPVPSATEAFITPTPFPTVVLNPTPTQERLDLINCGGYQFPDDFRPINYNFCLRFYNDIVQTDNDQPNRYQAVPRNYFFYWNPGTINVTPYVNVKPDIVGNAYEFTTFALNGQAGYGFFNRMQPGCYIFKLVVTQDLVGIDNVSFDLIMQDGNDGEIYDIFTDQSITNGNLKEIIWTFQITNAMSGRAFKFLTFHNIVWGSVNGTITYHSIQILPVTEGYCE